MVSLFAKPVSVRIVSFQLEVNIEPDKGWQTEGLFVPPGFHIDAEVTGEDEKPKGEKGEQPFAYPMGIGGVMMNGCYGTNYKPGDPCYVAKDTTTLCLVSKRVFSWNRNLRDCKTTTIKWKHKFH